MFSEKKLQKVPDFVSIRCSSGACPLPRLIEKLSNFNNYFLDIMMFVMH